MTNEQKGQVREALIRYAGSFATQTEAAESLQGISASTISQVKNNNWELLSDRLWHNIARQVGFYCGPDSYRGQPADTTAYLLLRILLSDAQNYGMTYGIAMGEGLGKTFTACQYTREHENTCYLACNDQYNRKSFIVALLHAYGVEPKGTVPQMMEQFVACTTEKDAPLLVLDDAHTLKDRVLHLVVLLSNALAGNAGVVILGRDELRLHITEGVRLKKVGFDEIYKSIGRRFITLNTLGPRDVELVCRANGIYDEDTISYISETSGSNLHDAVRLICERSEMKAAA